MNKHLLVALFLPLILFVLFLVSAASAFAHPGGTAADGCHYCRSNCARWGEVEGARHCHGGSSEPAAPATQPQRAITRPTPTPRPKVSARPVQRVVTCSAVPDQRCPNHCTAGNDADCCSTRLSTYRWYNNWGCYPKQLSCSATRDNKCDSYCSAGNDHDCCLQKEGYTWYENWGCYPAQN